LATYIHEETVKFWGNAQQIDTISWNIPESTKEYSTTKDIWVNE